MFTQFRFNLYFSLCINLLNALNKFLGAISCKLFFNSMKNQIMKKQLDENNITNNKPLKLFYNYWDCILYWIKSYLKIAISSSLVRNTTTLSSSLVDFFDFSPIVPNTSMISDPKVLTFPYKLHFTLTIHFHCASAANLSLNTDNCFINTW